MVDYIMQTTYAEINLNENPIIVPACGHIITVESMDGHMQMKLVLRAISDKEQLEQRTAREYSWRVISSSLRRQNGDHEARQRDCATEATTGY